MGVMGMKGALAGLQDSPAAAARGDVHLLEANQRPGMLCVWASAVHAANCAIVAAPLVVTRPAVALIYRTMTRMRLDPSTATERFPLRSHSRG
jgi:hypothetical protein